MTISSSLDLKFDHSSIIATISLSLISNEKPSTLQSRKTNWKHFRNILEEQIVLNISLKIPEEVERELKV